MAKGKNTAQLCAELAEPLAAELGLELWDVRFEKEGGDWFLRYFIDKEGGVDINDCEAFSRAVDTLLDEADPIVHGYCLEVSSPGVERHLSKPWHFERCLGRPVLVRLIRARDGQKDFSGPLVSFSDGVVTLGGAHGNLQFNRAEAAVIRLMDDFDYNNKGVAP